MTTKINGRTFELVKATTKRGKELAGIIGKAISPPYILEGARVLYPLLPHPTEKGRFVPTDPDGSPIRRKVFRGYRFLMKKGGLKAVCVRR
jgi:hypothetical protein